MEFDLVLMESLPKKVPTELTSEDKKACGGNTMQSRTGSYLYVWSSESGKARGKIW